MGAPLLAMVARGRSRPKKRKPCLFSSAAVDTERKIGALLLIHTAQAPVVESEARAVIAVKKGFAFRLRFAVHCAGLLSGVVNKELFVLAVGVPAIGALGRFVHPVSFSVGRSKRLSQGDGSQIFRVAERHATG